MDEIVIDFETRSPVDIKKCGAYKYAQHPDTDVTMLCILDVSDKSKVRVWICRNFRHLYDTEVSDEELDDIIQSSKKIIAHNCPFERAIWKYIMVDRYGFKPMDVSKTVDTAVMCSMVGLPRQLEKASEIIAPEGSEKDMEGSKIMKRFMAPKKPTIAERRVICPGNPEYAEEMYNKAMDVLSLGGIPDFEYHKYLKWHEDKNDFIRTVEYCRRDVLAEYYLYMKLPRIHPSEHDIWVLDQEINDRGICIDIESAKGISKTISKYQEALMNEALELTDGMVTTMKSPKQIKEWLLAEGIETDSIDKAAIEFLLTLDLNPKVRRFLEIRQTLGKSSIAKYDAMFACASNEDNRVRGMYVFYGAGTGRFSSRLIQIQNLPRPSGKANLINPDDDKEDIDEQTILLMSSGDPSLPLIWFKDLNVLAADCIRGMLMAPKGRDFICSDYSSVEARAIAYIANEETDLDAYRNNKDIYKVTASSIYGISYEEVDGGGKGPQRQVGKTAVLACGYSGGLNSLMKFSFDKIPVTEKDMYHAIQQAPEVMQEDSLITFVKQIYGNNYTDDYVTLIKDAYENPKTREVAEQYIKEIRGTWIVKQWRKAHPKVVQLWYDMKRASIDAVLSPKAIIEVGDKGVNFRYVGNYLIMRLPSGRPLFYMAPEVEEIETPWGSKQKVVTSLTMSSVTHKMERRQLNISILVENLVQAFCRDLLRESMLRLDKNGYDIVAHIHDEVLSEVDEGKGSVEEYEALMSITPPWAEGMPLKAAGGYRAKRYRK